MRQIRAIRAAAADLLAPVPRDNWLAIEERLDRGEAVLLPDDAARSRKHRFRAPQVAGFAAILLGVSVAAALVASPIAGWAGRLFDERSVAEAAPEAGLATVPQSTEVRVNLIGSTSAVTVRISRGAPPLLEVKGRGAAAEAEFVLRQDGIDIVGATGGEVLLLVPEGTTVRLEAGPSAVVSTDSVDVVLRRSAEGAP